MGSAASPVIVDTHAHLDDAAFAKDRDDVIAASRAAGVVAIINIGYRPESWEHSARLHERYPFISFSLGLHPQQADEWSPELAVQLRDAVRELRPVAIGEIGFDFFRPGPTFTEQERVFHAQLELAAERSLPVIIHQRSASEALMTALDRWPELPPIVLHSFDGDGPLMDWANERGCYFGVGGLATKPSSRDLRTLLGRTPLDRLLLETDSPYLSPPKAPSRRNTPANLPVIAALLAPLWDLSSHDLIVRTTANAATLFNLDLSSYSVAGSAGHGTSP